ncbi:MAG: DegT/DnrJ/EryC1/StrS family aminotransferase [Actinobacteria bacterium]|nr:DegT/DnrJ/EryC1/StrS family aminotransferase [Actinomycetota bacterium]
MKEDIDNSVLKVLSSGGYILGPEVESFEHEMAEYLGSKHAIGVASGTDAIFLILKALDVCPSDEVITTPFTFIATADTISNCGAKPVFADINPNTYNIDPNEVEKCFSSRTKAVIAVHLYGQPAEMDSLKALTDSHGVPLVEDCAQSLGAEFKGRKAGSIGTASALSFFPTKNLGGAGDGGMVCTNDARLADRIRMLRVHGSHKKYHHSMIGINSRLDAIQAALLKVKLNYLDTWNGQRIETANYYNRNLKNIGTPYVMPSVSHVYHQYTIRIKQRDQLQELLGEAGIGTSVYYKPPLHLQDCYRDLGHKRGDFPVSEKASTEVLSLPMFPGITQEEKETVCDAVNNFSG